MELAIDEQSVTVAQPIIHSVKERQLDALLAKGIIEYPKWKYEPGTVWSFGAWRKNVDSHFVAFSNSCSIWADKASYSFKHPSAHDGAAYTLRPWQDH